MTSERSVFIRAVILILSVASAVIGGCGVLVALEPGPGPAPVTRIERTRLCMGVPARITVAFPSGADQQPVEAAIERAFALLASLDDELSDYRLDSALNRVNAAAGGSAVAIGEPLATVLAVSVDVSRASDGAFDATAGPASRAWREARSSRTLPDDAELARIRRLVNWRNLELDAALPSARLAVSGMRLDLGGIGKGFAAQRAVDQLRADGFPRAMVALAGDIAVGDAPLGTNGWRIDVAPSSDLGLGTVELANRAISTSGDAEQFVEIAGRRYSHIVDPGTGLGTPGGVAVAVIAPRGEWADALSTAAVVMLTCGEPEARVAAVLRNFPGSRAIVERRGWDGQPVRTTIDPG